MKILPIETNPYVKAYTYHSYQLSILGSNRYCGEKKAEILIDSSTKYNWEFITNEISIDNQDYTYNIYGDKYADNIEARIFREADVTDVLVVKIKYLQYTQPYGYASVYLSDAKISQDKLQKVNKYYKIGVYNKGNVFSESLSNYEQSKKVIYLETGYYMKLEKISDEINCWVSTDSDDWTLISCYHIDNYNKSTKFHIGVHIYLGDNQFYNWLYTNYIQLYGRNVFSSEFFVDYFVTPEKDGNFNTVHSLLNYSIMDKSILLESGVDIIQFIKSNINKGNYIDFILNEFYLNGTEAYQNIEFHHANLIYGYDSFGIYILGYSKEGYLQTRRIEYDLFLKSLDNGINHLCVYSFAPLDSYYKLNIDTIKKSLNEYWKGINTNLGIEFLLPKRDRESKTTIANNNNEIYSDKLPEFFNIYGLHIYDVFLVNDIMIDYLLKDKRVSYVLYEHKKIMKDRINYLCQKKHIRIEYINHILELTDMILHESNILMNLCLKYKLKQNRNDKNKTKVRNKLKELKELEEEYYPILINSLC